MECCALNFPRFLPFLSGKLSNMATGLPVVQYVRQNRKMAPDPMTSTALGWRRKNIDSIPHTVLVRSYVAIYANFTFGAFTGP